MTTMKYYEDRIQDLENEVHFLQHKILEYKKSIESIKFVELNEARVLGTLFWFNREMKRKLLKPKNLRKRQWTVLSVDYLDDLLLSKVHDLTGKIIPHKEAIDIATDVANIAMMIADNSARSLEKGQKK